MTHPRTAMLDLLEELRLGVQRQRGELSDAQVLVVIAELMADHRQVAFAALSSQKPEQE